MECRDADCTWQLGLCRWRKPASGSSCCFVVFLFKILVLAQQAPLQLPNIGALLGQGRLLLLQLLCLHACKIFALLPFADLCRMPHHLSIDWTQHCSHSSKLSALSCCPACSSKDNELMKAIDHWIGFAEALTRLCTRRMRLMVRVCPGPAAMLCSFLSAMSPSLSSSLSLASCSLLSSSLLAL